ncbi:NAD(P)/FAD-dependent oxidoreductase [Arthrobacter sp. CAN_C5]|uniref:FAD-dependent oxidoreductase n=1 Tax=Arthrobacter sp. CAN_C5 TaxID=2760706 RepID=UPI001AE53F9F|nr:NAD(P)/FAD-dependent oxidoreductase [Arthrobacter sp. CAN_C5]MBP2218125.1 2-polyprenyl-6-methoxyphenol hydroxylase-like FAD-dependent oxidoreductase [Arthrobacter sp. CAN_C5]
MHDVILVGGGPVGLYAAILLRQAGLDVLVLEQRTTRSNHSRAIGIHPPALQALAEAGVADELMLRGVKIREGVARSAGREVTRLSFTGLPGDYPFVLAVPQVQTERVLEDRLAEVAPGSFRRGVEVTGVFDTGPSMLVTTASGEVLQAQLVIGADGGKSTVRASAGVTSSLQHYPDTYLMGDFADTSEDRSSAVLYLEPDGIVESFPLPDGVRRWVVRTPSLIDSPTAAMLGQLILDRTGVSVDVGSTSMLSAFGVHRRLARRFVVGRTVLIGDAAHQVSPIGGQGMNLGWLDVTALVPIITASLIDGADVGQALAEFDAGRRRAARTAARQAHLNMALGRPLPAPVLALRNALFGRGNRVPAVHDTIARTFTMQ